ncbi:M15 family metallopeptidase [Synechococcus sp. PCC 6312]|uniref:M15 family metallopeptidase n=1 Tax=Synechococcus sp. (strain ATCC 27167 / PCC 6312) TaxID=195253 RepID=UPI00029EDE2A|nr:M15 family metallopeptidase [Synechococcus sp. PCC 6312]AFY59426.1 D-alanyl-D-alanine dipeptidase [Synechococcus sp. PCC 6312]
MKPYQLLSIQDCHESLVPIDQSIFFCLEPHPYLAIGAPYDTVSPFYLRQGVLNALYQAQQNLQSIQPTWKLAIFDAYRPVAVQDYMVNYTFQELLRGRGLTETMLSPSILAAIWAEVYTFWAVPSHDPKTPPPHSTGAAIDLTLVDSDKKLIDMGSPIDEISDRSFPEYFYHQAQRLDLTNQKDDYLKVHQHREILDQAMSQAGFQRHPQEWWHFSLGDQLWAWQIEQQTGQSMVAHYGRADLITSQKL